MQLYDHDSCLDDIEAFLNSQVDADDLDAYDSITGFAAGLSNSHLFAAFAMTDGEIGNPAADALADEIERRGLGV